MEAISKNDSWLFTLCKICTFFLFMDSMYPWYMWNNKLSLYTFLSTIITLLILRFKKPQMFIVTKGKVEFSLLLSLSIFWLTIIHGSIIVWITRLLPILLLIYIRREYKIELLKFITKWFAILLFVSYIFYLLHWFGISLSPQTITFFDGRYYSKNYFFFITSDLSLEDGAAFFRFKSIFMEPGHLTMGLIPLIMANRFNLKSRYVVILSIIELLTFSLAGWITWIVGYVYFNFSVKKLKYVILGSLSILLFIIILQNIGQNEIVDTLIFNRLEFQDGKMVGDNRSGNIDALFSDFIKSSDKWYGLQTVKAENMGDSSGYKRFILDNGLISFILIVFLYTYYFFRYKKYDIAGLTLILLMLLYQNGYPFWFCVISMYILGCENFLYQKKIT